MSSVATTVEVSAAVSAVVSAVVGSVIRWGGLVLGRIKNWLPDDHSALYSSTFRSLTGISSFGEGLPIFVACAPSRRLRRPGFDPDLAVLIIEKQLPGVFPQGPNYSSLSQGIRFQFFEDASTRQRTRELCLCRDGRIDLYLTVDPTPTPSIPDSVGLSMVEVLRPLLTLLFFIQRGNYDKLYRRHKLRFRRRFDWFFVVAQNVVKPDMTNAYWIAQFPGRSAKRVADQLPFCPSDGFASKELRGWSTRRPWEEFARVALRSLLINNGYHNVDAALDDIIESVRADLLPQLDSSLGIIQG